MAGNALFSLSLRLGKVSRSREFFAQARGIFVPAQGNFSGGQGIRATHG